MKIGEVSKQIILNEKVTIEGDIETVITHIEERRCAKDLLKVEGESLIAEIEEFKMGKEVGKNNELRPPILTNLCLALGVSTGEIKNGTGYEWADCDERGSCPICGDEEYEALKGAGLAMLKMALAEQEGKALKIEIFDTGNINELLERIEDAEMAEVSC